MNLRRLRHKAGALIYDWPRFLLSMAQREGWIRYRNRNERLTVDPATGGARCDWMFTSDIHLCSVYPSAASWLLRTALQRHPIELAAVPPEAGEPRVSFILGHRGESRVPLLLSTLASIAGQRDAAIECIVVEQSESPAVAAHLPAWVRYIHTKIDSDDEPYNRSWAFNVGARAARSPLLVLHDNDFLVPISYAAELVNRHDEGNEFIDLKRFMFYLSSGETQRVTTQRRLAPYRAPERVMQNALAGGSVAADRAAYFAIGGFDESFIGWGGEDNDFWERASTRRTYPFAYLPFIHLWHAPQGEKLTEEPAGGLRRLREVASRSPQERIAILCAREFGRSDRPSSSQ